MELNEEQLYNMDDDALEAAYNEAIAEKNSPDVEEKIIEETVEEVEQTELTDEIEELEKPEEDNLEKESDSEDSSEDSTEEVTEEDNSENEDEILDEDSEENEDESSEEATEEKDEEQPVQSYKFKANGKDYEFTSEEIVNKFPEIFGQAMDYTKKMQAIKPWRKTIDAIEQAKLNHTDVNLMIDVLKGDKTAIAEVLKRTGVDTLDIDTEEESKYEAKDYGRDDKTLAVKEIVEEISSDTEFATTRNILSNDWDEASWNVLSDNPEMIRLLHEDVKTGMYSSLRPLMEKLKVYDGAKQSDIQYYKLAAEQQFQKNAKEAEFNKKKAEREEALKVAKQEKLAKAKADSQKRETVKQASVKRKAAAPTKSSVTNKGVVDYLNSSDEDFEEWYNSTIDS